MSHRRTAIVLIGIGVLVLLGSLTYLLVSAGTTSLALPQKLVNLPLTNAIYGPEAVTEINRLHGKAFPLTAGATPALHAARQRGASVGHYGNDSATLWVSQFASRAVAGQIVDAMRDKIAEGRSPFQPSGTRQSGSRLIYELSGLGQQHFYFQANDLVIWLAVDQALANQALSQTLEVYP